MIPSRLLALAGRLTLLALLLPAPVLGEAPTRDITAVVTDPATGQLEEVPLYHRAHAVIIGIDHYPNLPPDRQLDYAVSDARAVERMLRDKYRFDSFHVLYDGQATRSGILDLFDQLHDVDPQDAVFVFFAGHAGQRSTVDGDVGYLLPSDGSPEHSSDSLSMTVIRDDISKLIPAKHVFFVMDCCYSGLLLTRSEPAAPQAESDRNLDYLRTIAKERVRQVLSAGAADERVLDQGPYGHSVFTGRFLEVLDNTDDYITASEISAQVKERVFSDAQARGHVQTPQSGALYGQGDFIFMPSSCGLQHTISEQIGALEAEAAQLAQAEAHAAAIQDESARRDAERARQAVEARLAAQRLEEQRLQEEKTRREQELALLQHRKEEERQRQAAEEARLERLRAEVEAKRASMTLGVTTDWSGAVAEMEALGHQLADLRNAHREELRQRILTLAMAMSSEPARVAKDEFETDEEYEQRLSAHLAGAERQLRFQEAQQAVQASYDTLAAPLLAQMSAISGHTFTLAGEPALQVTIGPYSADEQAFALSIWRPAAEGVLIPGAHYQVVTGTGSNSQARRVGLQKNDIPLTYEGFPIHDGFDFEAAKALVRGTNATMEVLRGGSIHTVTLEPGSIGIQHETRDIEGDAHAIWITGWLKVPREEARKLKQDVLNGFVRPEVEVRVLSSQWSEITAARLVDEAEDHAWDLFKAGTVRTVHGLTWDRASGVFWEPGTDARLTQPGATRRIEGSRAGLTGWRLPSTAELLAARHHVHGFRNDEYQTRERPSSGQVYQINMESGQRCTVAANDEERSRGTLDPPEAGPVPVEWYGAYAFPGWRFVQLVPNTRLFYDTSLHLVWEATEQSRAPYWDAVRLSLAHQASGLRGWRLPSTAELLSLYDPATKHSVIPFQKLADDEFQTRERRGTETIRQVRPQSNWAGTADLNDDERFLLVF